MKFLSKAQTGVNDILLYVGMIFFVYIGMQLGGFVTVGLLLYSIQKNPNLGSDDLDTFYTNPDFAAFGIDPNLGFLMLLLSFVVGFLVLFFLFPVIHRRKFKTLITPTDKIDFGRILFGFIIWLLIGCVIEFTQYYIHPESFSFNFESRNFIPLLLLSLLILPIQTSLEELIFRSYLFQGIGNMKLKIDPKFKIVIAWIFTSVLFGAIHGANPEVQNFGLVPMMFYYIGAGLFLGLLTIWDDRLELALGVHAATNFVGAVLVGYNGAAIQTESLFKTSEINVINMTIGFYVGALIFTFICKRKYGWNKFLKVPTENYKEIT